MDDCTKASWDDFVYLIMQVEPGANRKIQRDYIVALIELCTQFDADAVIDIGTNRGTSALATASALYLLGKPVVFACTIDLRQGLWNVTKERVGPHFSSLGMDLQLIQSVECDFKALIGKSMVPQAGEDGIPPRLFCFYDIHDLEDGSGRPNSPIFIEQWIPHMEHAIVAVHDMVPRDADWVRPLEWGVPPSVGFAQHWQGQWFAGTGECKVFIEYLNEHETPIHVIPDTSIIYFGVKGGGPVDAHDLFVSG